MTEQRPDRRLVRKVREDLDGAESEALVLVLEPFERERNDARRWSGLDDRERLPPNRRGGRVESLGDQREIAFRRVPPQPVERDVDDCGIDVAEESGQPVGEGGSGVRGERFDREAPDVFVARDQGRVEGVDYVLVGPPGEKGLTVIAERGVGVGDEPRDVFGLESPDRADLLD